MLTLFLIFLLALATVWFRNGAIGGNINDAGRWNDKADDSGNDLTWANLAAGDVLCANGKTSIAINVSVTCAKLSNLAEVGSSDTGTAGGNFTVAAAVTLTVAQLTAGPAALVVQSGTNTWSLTGDTYGGSASNSYGVRLAGACVFNHTGSSFGGSGAQASGVLIDASVAATYIQGGNQYGGSITNARGFTNGSDSTFIITGTVEGGAFPTANGIYNQNPAAGAGIVIGNILNTVGKAHGVGGYSVDWRPAAANYSRWQSSGSTIDAPQGLTAANIKAGVVSGTVTGTFAGGGVCPIGSNVIVGGDC